MCRWCSPDMMDEVRDNGGSVLVNETEKLLGIPVIPISAAKNEGIGELIEHALHVAKYQEKPGRRTSVTREDHAERYTAACTESCT